MFMEEDAERTSSKVNVSIYQQYTLMHRKYQGMMFSSSQYKKG